MYGNLIEKLHKFNYHSFGNINYTKTIWIYDEFNNVTEEKEIEGYVEKGEYIQMSNRIKTKYEYTYDKYNNWVMIHISEFSYENGNEKVTEKIFDRSIEYCFKDGSTYSS